jgi:hypothetical protein
VASVLMLDDAAPADPALGKALQTMHPDAVRITSDFVVPPAPTYPAAAIAERRQLQQDVIVVVREDGAVAALDGTLGDSMFDAAIRSALAEARAEPPRVDGQPRVGWALLRFAFEFVGVRP